MKAVIKNEQLDEKQEKKIRRQSFLNNETCKHQQYSLREGSFVVRNLCVNFHVSLLLTANFTIYSHPKLSSL